MGNAIVLLVHLLARLTVVLGPGGTRAVLAENILLKQQLLILRRPRRRAPNLRPVDRVLIGFAVPEPSSAPAHRHYPQARHPAALSSWVQGFQISIPLLSEPEEQARSKRARIGTDPSHL